MFTPSRPSMTLLTRLSYYPRSIYVPSTGIKTHLTDVFYLEKVGLIVKTLTYAYAYGNVFDLYLTDLGKRVRRSIAEFKS